MSKFARFDESGKLLNVGEVADKRVIVIGDDGEEIEKIVQAVPGGTIPMTDWEYNEVINDGQRAGEIIARLASLARSA